MAKLWAGRTDGATDALADAFNSSFGFDRKMYREDIAGSIAHAEMLGKTGILEPEEAERIIAGLEGIRADIESGRLGFDAPAEDIHMFIESELTARIGDAGKRLHTARSRNDQVALDFRMWMRSALDTLGTLVTELIEALADKAEEEKTTIMPGYTHLQRAQPIVFGHHLLAYAMMLFRDAGRLRDAAVRLDESPIGSCALAGTTYATDRALEASLLGFGRVMPNSLDGVSDRDFALESLSAAAILMMHLSRLAEELILWSSWEFRFVTLDDAYTTGSSIMPQKKNPDMAELVRGKTGRVYGHLMALLATMKGLPLAYNKDMQEDKEGVFDACETAMMCLRIMAPMIATMRVNREAMRRAAGEGFINATDLADYLTRKGMPFRDAYKLSGQMVAHCIAEKTVLEDLPIEAFRQFSPLFGEDVYDAIRLETCVEKRISEGGTSLASVEKQLALVREKLREARGE